MTTRRAFLKAGAVSIFGIGVGGIPPFLGRAAGHNKISAPFKKNKILVCIFQRGAMDGLMAVTPFNDAHLKSARPNLFMSPAQTQGASFDLDGRFALHPSLKSLTPIFHEKRLAIVHGMGSLNTTRSHFDAQDYMELGTPFSKNTASGWLNRVTGMMGHNGTPFRAVSMTSSMPRSLYGENPALAISDLREFAIQIRGNPSATNLSAKSFEDLYDQTASSLLKETGKESFDAVRMLEKTSVQHYRPANEANYPNSPLSNALKQIAQLIKIDVGLEIAFAESGGWDTHFNQGTTTGVFARNLKDLSESILAFWTDIESFHDEVTIMTMTEFGRTVKQNGTGGTDHGRASCNFILGNDVNGGVVYGDVKSLAQENLEDGRDLPVTTDFRTVFNNVATQHLQIQRNSLIFPDWTEVKMDLIRQS